MQASPDEMRQRVNRDFDRQGRLAKRRLAYRLVGYGALLLLALGSFVTHLLNGPLAVVVATGVLFVCGLVGMEVQRKRRHL